MKALFSFSKGCLFLILFSVSLSVQGWGTGLEDFSFFLPERIKPKRVVSSTQAQGVDMLVRALEGATPAMLAPYAPKLRVPCNSTSSGVSLSNVYCRINAESTITDAPLHSHIFAVATHTLQMYETAGVNFESWTLLPLYVLSGNKDDTAYQLVAGSKRICFYGTARNDFDYDVVAHEVGHSVLDHLRPDFRGSRDPFTNFQLRTLHEAFADVTAVFSSLHLAAQQGSFAPEINSLFASRDVTAIAPQYAGNPRGLRNPSFFHNYPQYIQNGEFHKFSQIMTGLAQNIVFDLCTHELGSTSGASLVDADFAYKIRGAFLKSFLKVEIDGNVIENLGTILGANLKKVYPSPLEEEVRDHINARVEYFQQNLRSILVPPN